MSGLMIKDILNLRNYLKQLLLVLIFFIVYGVLLGKPEFVNFMMIMYGSMVILTTLGYDEKAGWEKMAVSLPVTRREIVKAKYLLWGIMNMGVIFISVVFGLVSLHQKEDEIVSYLISVLVVEAIYIIVFAIILPFVFKLGVEKARLIMFGIIVLPAVGIVFLAKYAKADSIFATIMRKGFLWGTLFLVLMIISVLVSYMVSVRIFEKKDI